MTGPVRFLVGALFAAAIGSPAALAQVRPDAGSLQRDIDRDRVPPSRPPSLPPPVEQPARPALRAPADARFFVKGFRITRASAFPEAELAALIGSFAGQTLSLADLQRAADTITRHYRDKGYFIARAYVPAQDIRDGIVEITVLEGTLGGIRLQPISTLRLRPAQVTERLRAAIPRDRPVTSEALDRGLLLLNDLPGIDARAVLAPGDALGETNVTAEVDEGRIATGSIEADNHGNKFTGRLRLAATLAINDATGLGDQFSARVATSQGTKGLRLTYQIPLGYSGLRVGLSYSQTDYLLCCEFAALRAEGFSRSWSLSALYPFVRSRDWNLYGTAALDRRRFYNTTIAGPTSDKGADVLALGLNADLRDSFGGYTSAGLTLHAGRLDLSRNAADATLDATTARTAGGYDRTAFSLARLQRLGESTSFHAALGGQLAGRNLDSSEKFVLGGPTGVRAYPMGEAAGDEGLLVNLEVRYESQPGLQWSAFVDQGWVRLHRTPWAGWQGTNPQLPNQYGLLGAGLGLQWSQPGDFLIRASVAQRLGSNPGRDTAGNDSDNTRDRTQFWLQGSKRF